MQLSTIVKPDAVRTYPQVSSKKRLFQDIAEGMDDAEKALSASTPGYQLG